MTKLDLFFTLGRPFSPIYSSIQTLRAYCYKKGLLKSYSMGVPVISIGNLTMGGTGKTPMVAMLTMSLLERGYRPAVISRGYGGCASDAVNIVSEGSGPLMEVEQAGDEPYMLASILEGVTILTGKKRQHPCRYAIDKCSADVLILDDGFQHLPVKRDLDIVLFSASTLAGNSRVFPGGDLREPVSALLRADVFVLTGVNERNNTRATSFSELLEKKFPHIPVILVGDQQAHICDHTGNRVEIMNIAGPCMPVVGIANPERFIESLKTFELQTVDAIILKDHASYSATEVDHIRKMVSIKGAKAIITTHKDFVKSCSTDFGVPLYYLSHQAISSPPLLELIFGSLNQSK